MTSQRVPRRTEPLLFIGNLLTSVLCVGYWLFSFHCLTFLLPSLCFLGNFPRKATCSQILASGSAFGEIQPKNINHQQNVVMINRDNMDEAL